VKYDLDETEDGWHYFGMDWQPDGYVFYCDGEEVTRDSEYISHVPEFLLITTEVRGWRGPDGGLKVEGEFEDDAFIVDFVRVYDKV
jgi:beta-glucanase (GH16 family)